MTAHPPGEIPRSLDAAGQVRRSAPTLELAACGLITLLVPASMSTPWGSLGAYVAAVVSVLVVVGFFRARATFSEIRKIVPSYMVAIILGATALAAMTQQYDWAYVRGTPVQWTSFLGVMSLASLWQVRGGDPKTWLKWILGASAIISGLAIYEYAAKNYVHIDDLYSFVSGIHFDDSAYRRSSDSFRSISTMGNPLALGTLSAVAACGALGLYLERVRFWLLLIFVANALATFASLSRSSWLALLVSSTSMCIAYFFVGRSGNVRMHLHLLAAAALALIVMMIPASQDYFVERIAESFDTASGRILELQDSISYSHRVSALSDALGSMVESPHSLLVGFGLGAENNFFLADTATPLTGVTAKDASLLRTFDNTYVTVAYSFGAFGLIWFLRIIILRLLESRRQWNRPYWYLGMLFAAAICLYFYNGISAPSASYVVACLFGFHVYKGAQPLAEG